MVSTLDQNKGQYPCASPAIEILISRRHGDWGWKLFKFHLFGWFYSTEVHCIHLSTFIRKYINFVRPRRSCKCNLIYLAKAKAGQHVPSSRIISHMIWRPASSEIIQWIIYPQLNVKYLVILVFIIRIQFFSNAYNCITMCNCKLIISHI